VKGETVNRYLPLIITGVLLNAGAQVFIKNGMLQIGYFSFKIQNVIPVGFKVAANISILSGVACYVVSLIVWLMVLSRVEVSYAYPLLSIGYIVAAFAGKLIFGETIDLIRWAGILIICIGVYLITKSAS